MYVSRYDKKAKGIDGYFIGCYNTEGKSSAFGRAKQKKAPLLAGTISREVFVRVFEGLEKIDISSVINGNRRPVVRLEMNACDWYRACTKAFRLEYGDKWREKIIILKSYEESYKPEFDNNGRYEDLGKWFERVASESEAAGVRCGDREKWGSKNKSYQEDATDFINKDGKHVQAKFLRCTLCPLSDIE